MHTLTGGEEKSSALRYLESKDNLSDAAFAAMIARNRILHLSKKHKFKRLESLGLIKVNYHKIRTLPTKEERPVIARDAYHKLLRGESIEPLCVKYGVKADTIQTWINKAGLYLRPNKQQIDEKLANIGRLINEGGYNWKEACELSDVTPATARIWAKKRGLVYSARRKTFN